MSGQWEVVRGKNDKRSKLPVPKENNKQPDFKGKKSNILNGVRIEDVLPKSQVQNLYSGKPTNKENKPHEKTKPTETKKPEKKSSKPPAEPPKPKPPKSIEAGLHSITTEEFHLVYNRSKTAFPDTPIVWLKDLTQFLNQKIPIEIQDPVFSSKPLGYPLNVMPANLKAIIEKAIKEAGKSNSQLYFDIALTSMVTDLSKGLPAVGYRFFLQYIALNEPKLVTENLSKHVSLRNSYQNRANVALSILWAVGHVGVNDFHCGLKVFEDLKLPLLEMKNYSKYIVKYLLELTNRDHKAPLTRDQYLLILDTIFSNKKNFPLELQKDLVQNIPKLSQQLLNNKRENFHGLIEPLIKRLSQNTKAYQNCLCQVLVEIFTKDQTTLNAWNKIYAKNLLSSAVLLKYITRNSNNLKPALRNSLKDLLLSFSSINTELSGRKKKDEGLKEALEAVKEAQEEQKQTKPKSRGLCRAVLSSFIIAFSMTVLLEPFINLDRPKNDLCLFRLSGKVQQAALWVDSKLEQSIPDSYGQVKQVAEPYGALSSDLVKLGINALETARGNWKGFINEKYPLAVASIDHYAPGLLDNTKEVLNKALHLSVHYYRTVVDYLKKEVFIGQLSPENIQRVVVGAYNTTSEKAVEYYHWVYQKVQTIK
ncbi:transmembrane protein 214 isoform X1 [Euwallacea similis]|uniref:transmembrane protein 214 isoform X1 n=1 Tax=Euwallacea similis TaxID=1736056 RepID=UPI0034500C85